MHLTDLSVRSLKRPYAGQITYHDDTLPGFGVRVASGGTKSFVLIHGPARTRVTLGRYPIVTLADARTKAKQILAGRTLGQFSPLSIPFEEALEEYLGIKERNNKPSSYKTTRRRLRAHFLPRLRRSKVRNVEPDDISKCLSPLADTPSEQRHAFVAVQGFFNWCERKRYVDRSPAKRVEAPRKGKSRTRVLNDQELAKVASYAILGEATFDKIVALLILGGQRRGQIGSLRGEWIDRKEQVITFPPIIMKSNREHVVPYGAMVAAILHAMPETGLLFPGEGTDNPFDAFSKPKLVLDRETGVTDWTLHDLRRTVRTNLGKFGVGPHIGERILDHRSAIVNEVEETYDRYKYLAEMRDALDLWEGHIAALIAKQPHSRGDLRPGATGYPAQQSSPAVRSELPSNST